MDNSLVGNIAGGLVIVTIILVVMFLVFREFVCWYWKINERIALLTEIKNLLAAKPVISKNNLQTYPPSPQDQTSLGQISPVLSPEKECAAVLHKLGYQLIEEDRLDDGKPSKKWTITSPTRSKDYVFSIDDLVKRVKMIAKRQGVIFDANE